MRELRFRPLAEADLISIYDYISKSGDPQIAGDFVAVIEAACRNLLTFPEGGRPRDDLGAGIRTISVRRRVTIAYRLTTHVEIVAVAYAGRDLAAEFREIPQR